VFDLVVLCLGLVVTLVLAGLKLAAYVSLGWLGVFVPIIVGIVIVLLKHGLDVTDFLPD
jgi:hypothetical protein